jgi:3-hydroxybutyryl-CoA dehydratase
MSNLLVPGVGVHLPRWRHCVLSTHARAWSEALDDPNPVHFDGAAVTQLGLGTRPINQGPANIAYLYNMLETCFPGSEVVLLDARLVGTVKIGDTVEATGHIVEVEDHAAWSTLRCELVLSVCGDGMPAVLATAEVRVERDSLKAVPVNESGASRAT